MAARDDNTDETNGSSQMNPLKKHHLRILTSGFEHETVKMIKAFTELIQSGHTSSLVAVQISARLEFLAEELQPRGLTVTVNDWVKVQGAWADSGRD